MDEPIEKEINKYAECVNCKKFFDCKTRKEKPDKCLYFQERKETK